MINVPPLRAAIASAPGNEMVITKEQLAELLDDVERGQRAERELTNIRSVVAAGGMRAQNGSR